MKPNMMILAGALAFIPGHSQYALAQAAKPAVAIPFVTEQPANEWLAHVFIGADVLNAAGENVGDVRDLVFDRAGRISTVVIGVGGFLGVGEKHVAVPFSTLTYGLSKDNTRVITVAISKEDLKLAPAFILSWIWRAVMTPLSISNSRSAISRNSHSSEGSLMSGWNVVSSWPCPSSCAWSCSS